MLQNEMKYTNTSREFRSLCYVIQYGSYIFTKKTFIRALDNVISYTAMVINKNYNRDMYCCMNNKQLIKSTPNHIKY